MKKIIFFIFLLFSFTSCTGFYVDDGSTDKVVTKTAITDIGDCTEPIVITMPVYKYSYLFGNKNNSYKQERLGDIFVVIDTETNELYDWVFSPAVDGVGSYIWRCVELGTNPKKYFSSAFDGTQSYIQAGKSTVTQIHTNCYKTYMGNYSSRGAKGVLEYSGYDSESKKSLYQLTVFDSETETVKEKKLNILNTCIGYIGIPLADEDGNFYISYPDGDYNYIEKIDIDKNTQETLERKFSNRKEDDSHQTIDHKVLGIYDNYIFVKEDPLGSYKYNSYLYVLDKNNLENEKKFRCPKKINEEEHCFYIGVYYNKKFYILVPISFAEKFYILEIDPLKESGEAELFLEEPILFDFTENVWLRGSKLYVMCSRNTSNVTFMYIDLETKEQSQVFQLKYEEIIKN